MNKSAHLSWRGNHNVQTTMEKASPMTSPSRKKPHCQSKGVGTSISSPNSSSRPTSPIQSNKTSGSVDNPFARNNSCSSLSNCISTPQSSASATRPFPLVELKRKLFSSPSPSHHYGNSNIHPYSRNTSVYKLLTVAFLTIFTIINGSFIIQKTNYHYLEHDFMDTGAYSPEHLEMSNAGQDANPHRNLSESKVVSMQSKNYYLEKEEEERKRTMQRKVLVEQIPHLLKTLESISTASSSPNSNNNQTHIELSNVIKRDSLPNQNSITLVTQGHVSKFPRLLALLERWQGPISCAMYITSQEDLYTWYNYVQQSQTSMDGNNGQTLFDKFVSMHLVFEAKPSMKSEPKVFYPINILRNLALRNAKHESEYVFLDDIDLIPSSQAHDSILATLHEQQQQNQNDEEVLISSSLNKTIWVLPAFERFHTNQNGSEINDILALIPSDKTSLNLALQNKDIAPFHAYNQPEQGPTDYARWYNETEIYNIEYGYNFEPYCIFPSKDLHDFYQDFRGYGWNKKEFYLEANIRGYHFQVLPKNFVVHLDHEFHDQRIKETDGNSNEIYPQFQQYLEDRYGISKFNSSIPELMKTAYRYRDTDIKTTNFPCHYNVHRNEEFNIVPYYNKKHHLNSLVEWIPLKEDDKYDVTIATMMHPSASMFRRLKQMATNWSGQISVAVFIENNDFYTIYKTKSKIKKLSQDNADFGARISFHLVIDLVPGRGQDVNVFPRNVLRNVALNNAQTDYVMVLDMDLIPSFHAHENLKIHLKQLDQDSDSKSPVALVVPAFEKSSKYGQNVTVTTKSALIETMEKDPRTLNMFLYKSKVQAHNATDYNRWYANDDSLYDISYQIDYEPYVVVRKDSNLPPFWEHFTGFGRNKLQWVEELFLSGFQFKVVPDSFVVHKNHQNYGLRKVRPFVVDEYNTRFSVYLEKVYGASFQDKRKLREWGERMIEKWYMKVHEGDKTKLVSSDAMAKMSKRREIEFVSCSNIIKVKSE